MGTEESVSIGPRLFRHGKSFGGQITLFGKRFQLGHVFSDMESESWQRN